MSFHLLKVILETYSEYVQQEKFKLCGDTANRNIDFKELWDQAIIATQLPHEDAQQ